MAEASALERLRRAGFTGPGADGVLVLAGILRTQFAEVRAAYEQAGMKLIAGRQENEWESGAFTRRSAG